jgi:hypothetical protein
LRGVEGKGVELKLEGASPGNHQRFIITLKDREVTVKRNDKETQHITFPADAPTRGSFGLRDTGGAVEFMNLYVRDR